jgi:hypothetical protein
VKRRLRKKLHRRHLFEVVADVSQVANWRRRLITDPGETCEIDSHHCDHLPMSLARVIRRYGLRYRVRVVTADEALEWSDEAAAGWVRRSSELGCDVHLQDKGPDRRTAEAADALANLLNIVWDNDEVRLRADEDAFAAFRGLLGWLADRQNVRGLELLGRINRGVVVRGSR